MENINSTKHYHSHSLTDKQKQNVHAMIDSGATQREVCEKFGFCGSTYWYYKKTTKRLGYVKKYYKSHRSEILKKMKEYMKHYRLKK